ncbi:Alpha/Beta hydrolase protein [Phascolomyces articulosus]|uniref:Alpha/Beta hydrolase protein n=1 Tax=Phascolomyces articulosus TaxID=60185 RepID=A0AAD5K7F5_9FUNG|nr:Alpha/Beta hydrolase protein [Phascolomyces articulosus]
MTEYKIGNISVIQRPSVRPQENDPINPYTPYGPESKELPKGWQKNPERNSLPLPEPLIIDKDVSIILRDGTEIYTDILRPADNERHPVLIAWSPYGKTGDGYFSLDAFPPYRVGVPYEELSNLEKFEAVDPAIWCAEGYVIVNVNIRGTYDSKGNIVWWGSQDGRDGYDVIEWAAKQAWSTGKVGLMGNSWLAISQWFIAAEQPPHLCAIAPWEGAADAYRDFLGFGGFPNLQFCNWLRDCALKENGGLCAVYSIGRRMAEDVPAMLEKYPLWNEYWEDKRAKLENITIPTYILGSYSSQLHTAGSFRAFQQIKTDKKWLRVHPYFEWYDLYQEKSNKDLLRFFNHYLKGESNDWESTPRVRLSLLGFNQDSVVERPEQEYPLARTQYKKFYLNDLAFQEASSKKNEIEVGTLSESKQSNTPSVISYNSENDDEMIGFTKTFDEYTEIGGYTRMTLWVSCSDNDDMDLFARLRKLDANGHLLTHINVPLKDMPGCQSKEDVPYYNVYRYVGAPARLRVSHRHLIREPKDGEEVELLRDHKKEEKVTPGTIIPVEVGFWPCGMTFEKGESLQVVLAGHDMVLPETKSDAGFKLPTLNRGTHNIHVGGSYPSSITLPFI